MERIVSFARPFYVALFVLAGAFAFTARPADAYLEGCWYFEGEEPACNICYLSCQFGQVCCPFNGGPQEQ